jgi:ribosomal-protein-serine acetyltransferase
MFLHRLDAESELTLVEPRHAEAMFRAIDTDRAHLREWLPWVDATRTPADTLANIEQSMRQYAANQGFQAAIWHRGELAGRIGFHGVSWANRATSLGYWLGSAYQGKGLMTRAVEAMVDHAFLEWKLNRVEIRCAPGNAKSRAIPERLGFTREGTLREVEWLYDRHVDLVVYGMLAREWRGR